MKKMYKQKYIDTFLFNMYIVVFNKKGNLR
jgi:hypothetical protein